MLFLVRLVINMLPGHSDGEERSYTKEHDKCLQVDIDKLEMLNGIDEQIAQQLDNSLQTIEYEKQKDTHDNSYRIEQLGRTVVTARQATHHPTRETVVGNLLSAGIHKLFQYVIIICLHIHYFLNRSSFFLFPLTNAISLSLVGIP